jgi:hypothetical protein
MVRRRKKQEIRTKKRENKIKEENKRKKEKGTVVISLFLGTHVYMHKIPNSMARFKLRMRPSLNISSNYFNRTMVSENLRHAPLDLKCTTYKVPWYTRNQSAALLPSMILGCAFEI